MRCPRCKTTLKKLGISLICPRCDLKKRDPAKYWIPELRRYTTFPEQYAWSSFTNTNITITSNIASLTTGQITGTMVSPQITNLTRSSTQLRDFTKAKINSITASKNDGRVYFYISNDGGTTWNEFYDNGHTKSLHYGKEAVTGQKQSKYNDLRLKIKLTRPQASDTSPTISELKLKYNQVPDTPWRVR